MNTLDGILVVGLTGQTGAGKSTVSKIFESNGYTAIDADLVARQVVEKGTNCLSEIVDFFGLQVLNPDETLNRKMLASIVFSDKNKLETLNTIIYPYITGEILRQINQNYALGNKLILLDAPTLFESRADDFCEIIISVLAVPELREQRIIVRDGLTSGQARARMNAQLSESFFVSHSDYIIYNNSGLDTLNEMSKEISDKIKVYYFNKINANC